LSRTKHEEIHGEYAASQKAHPSQCQPDGHQPFAGEPHPFLIKVVESAIADGKKADAADALKKVQPEIQRGVARGVIHKNTAARKISRLSKRVALLG
jgi:hypothetical protein